MLDILLQDIRYALRGIRRAPLYAATVAATIGLGLGVLTSAFTLVNAYVLRPIDLPDPYALVALSWDTSTVRRPPVQPVRLRDRSRHHAPLHRPRRGKTSRPRCRTVPP